MTIERTIDLPPLFSSAWYDERELHLRVPASWDVTHRNPNTPPPLSQAEIDAAIREPVGPRLQEIARGRGSAAIIVDDLTRPTPASLLLPALLSELEAAGIGRGQVTLMLGTGTHGPASADAARRKLGAAAEGCRVVPHDDLARPVVLGRTSFGSHVEIDATIARADLLVAVGGIYPQNTAGFGGGAKAVLGVLARRSVEDLHFGHGTDDGHYDIDNDFRRDIDEMAALAGLAFSVSALVDQRRRLIAVLAGDHRQYYRSGVERATSWFATQRESSEDVVIANAFPMDVSATFMRSKGIIPLLHASPRSSRVLVAGCPEGIGHHGLFPLRPTTGLKADARVLRRQLRYAPASVPGLVLNRVAQKVRAPARAQATRNRVICFVTSPAANLGPDDIPGMHVLTDWSEVLRQVEREQGTLDGLSAAIYPCSPLQVLTA
jgi:nickel-dependent lactate racemase